MEYDKSNSVIRLNYTNKINSVHCIVGENGSGKTRLMNSLLEKDRQAINKFFKDIDDIFDYSFVKFSSAVELYRLKELPEKSIDISTSAFLNTMNLVNLNREDSINQVEVISSYYNKKEEHTKWEDLIELSGKTVSLRLNQIGEGIKSYGKTYLKGTGGIEEYEAIIKKISSSDDRNTVLRTLMRKFFAVYATEILPQFEYIEKKRIEQKSESNEESKLLLENIDFKSLELRDGFYKDLEKYFKADTLDQDKISQLPNFFKDLRIIVDNVEKKLDFTDETDRETLKVILKSLRKDGSDNSISQEVFSILEFEWNGLSSGELALINLFGRLNSIKNKVKKNVVLLLDEVDLGLHPEWQRKWVNNVLPIIGKIMEKQNGSVRVVVTTHSPIILSTHSPIILSDFLAEDVIYLPEEPNKILKTFGQNIYTLFKNSFFLEAPKGAFSEQVIEDLLEIFGASSNKRIIQETNTYKEFIERYGLQFNDKTPIKEVQQFFEKLVDTIGEDIIRNHLKKQMEKASWYYKLNYEEQIQEKIDELKKRIKELEEEKEVKNSNRKNN